LPDEQKQAARAVALAERLARRVLMEEKRLKYIKDAPAQAARAYQLSSQTDQLLIRLVNLRAVLPLILSR
jgi:hypothetical protein